MSFEKSKFNFITREKLKDEQVSVEQLISGVSMDEIKQVLWLNTIPQLDGIDVLTKEATLSGKLIVDVVYLDTEDNAQNSQCTIPFLTKIISEKINSATKINATLELASKDFSIHDGKISAVINISLDVVNTNELEVLNSGDENICIKEENIISERILLSDCTEFNEEISLPISDNNVKILSVNCDAVIDDVQIGDNFFTVQGNIHSKIYFAKNDGENIKIDYISNKDSFRREIEANGINDSMLLDTKISIKHDNLSYEVDENEENSNKKILLNIPLHICYLIFEYINIPCAVDIFSLKNNLEVITSSYEKTQPQKPICFQSKVEGNITLADDEPRIDKICGISKGWVQTTNAYIKDSELKVEGIICFEGAYLNDELQKIVCFSKQFPFVVVEKVDATDGVKIVLKTNLLSLEVVARRGREIFIDTKLDLCVSIFETHVGAVITDAFVGEPLPLKEEAIEIYFGKKGEEIWDIAKNMRTKIDVIVLQNSEIISPLQEDQNIIIYHQKSPSTTSVLSRSDYDF